MDVSFGFARNYKESRVFASIRTRRQAANSCVGTGGPASASAWPTSAARASARPRPLTCYDFRSYRFRTTAARPSGSQPRRCRRLGVSTCPRHAGRQPAKAVDPAVAANPAVASPATRYDCNLRISYTSRASKSAYVSRRVTTRATPSFTKTIAGRGWPLYVLAMV